MSTPYKTLLKLIVRHSFFQDEICNCIQFDPTSSSANLLSRCGIHVVNRVDGFDLMIKEDAPIKDNLSSLLKDSEESNFEFRLRATNSLFYTFTDFPVNWQGQINYSTANTKGEADGSKQLLSEEKDTFDPEILGTLKIRLSDLISEDSGIPYQVKFDARKTQWQYFIINQSSVDLQKPMIKDNMGIAYLGPFDVELMNGTKALLFTSGDHFIPLNEYPLRDIDLLDQGENAQQGGNDADTKVVMKGLPNASANITAVVQYERQNILSSPVYVYL